MPPSQIYCKSFRPRNGGKLIILLYFFLRITIFSEYNSRMLTFKNVNKNRGLTEIPFDLCPTELLALSANDYLSIKSHLWDILKN
jgi:hypothetical protein